MTESRSNGARVLLVDDNHAFVENLTEILESAGHTVSNAPTVAAALLLAREGFDVALVDFKLPDGDGISLASALQELPGTGEVVLLTGFATLESAAAAVKAGAFAYLVKPCAPPELLLTIEQAQRHVRLQNEKRELAMRAQVAEKLAAVGTLTAGLSHEIRNPLNAAALQLSVVERRVGKMTDAVLRESLLEPLTLVREEIRRLDHILEDFLRFARPKELSAQPVALVPLIERVLDLLESDVHRRGIALVRSLESVPNVAGDEGRLHQVILNLMLNAMEAISKSGQIHVSTRAKQSRVLLSVADSGPGISKEVRPRIFEPFFTTKATGSGLGLAIVNAIVVQHGGSISIEGPAQGGTRFVVSLPVIPHAIAPIAK
jgi:two-component system, NtrC family, sensor histidine kinase HydH